MYICTWVEIIFTFIRYHGSVDVTCTLSQWTELCTRMMKDSTFSTQMGRMTGPFKSNLYKGGTMALMNARYVYTFRLFYLLSFLIESAYIFLDWKHEFLGLLRGHTWNIISNVVATRNQHFFLWIVTQSPSEHVFSYSWIIQSEKNTE